MTCPNCTKMISDGSLFAVIVELIFKRKVTNNMLK